jgi:Asp/Glu/hydantoin racemase
MKIVSITPIHVTDQELQRRQQRYNRIAPAGVTIELRNLTQGSPTALDTTLDVRASDESLLGELNAVGGAAADFVMPDCVLDPGFRLEGEGQVVGMLQNVLAHLAAKGHKIGAVTRNEAIGAELERRVAEYGFAENYVGREVLNLSFDAINDEELWHEALAKAVDSLAAQGATVVINGCSAVNVQQDRLKLEVVDPAELALQIISGR